MKNEEKIIELLAESLKGQDRIVLELKGSNQRLDQTVERLDPAVGRLDQTVKRLDHLEIRRENVEGQRVKLNIQTVENTRAIFKPTEKVEQIATCTTGKPT